jgi:hypothetical protein
VRNAVVVIGMVLVLVGLDAVFNQWSFTGSMYRDVLEFGRILNRLIAQRS